MNDQQIFEQVAREGEKLRAVQLADRMDVALEDARARLVSLVAVGDLVETDGFAPNGLETKLYSFSEAFKRSDAYKLVATKTEAATFGDPTMSKTDRAIAFVREKGTATSAELHALLGLAEHEYVSSYLARVVREGRLSKDGKNWTLGTSAPAEAPAPRSYNRQPVSSKKNGPVAQFPKTAQPEQPAADVEVPKFLDKRVEVKSQPADKAAEPVVKAAASHVNIDENGAITVDGEVVVTGKLSNFGAAPDDVPAPSFRAGLWSDGVLELQRNGQTIAKLQPDEGDHLAEFMQRMRVLLAA